MNGYIFLDKSKKPNEKEITHSLGDAYKTWKGIKYNLAASNIPVLEEWKYYSKKSGWTMKLLMKKRNLFFFTPLENSFRISFIFGDKAVEQINQTDIPAHFKNELNNNPKYAEGRGLSLIIQDDKDKEVILKLIALKINN